jgi:hypothetical protein
MASTNNVKALGPFFTDGLFAWLVMVYGALIFFLLYTATVAFLQHEPLGNTTATSGGFSVCLLPVSGFGADAEFYN